MNSIAGKNQKASSYFTRPLEVPPKKFPGLYSADELVRMQFPDQPPATDRTISLIHEASQNLTQTIKRYPACPECHKRVGASTGYLCVDWPSYRADNASWYYGHAGCTPQSPYDFRLDDFRTLRDVLDWTCHLGQKNWFASGSWLSIVNYICPQFAEYVEDAVANPHYWREFIFRGKKPAQQLSQVKVNV